jgi:hypothetical protein
LIHYVVDQEAATQGIKMSKGVELVFVIRQKTVILPKSKPTIEKGVHMAIKMKYSEPKIN